jgi:hypothetical protein
VKKLLIFIAAVLCGSMMMVRASGGEQARPRGPIIVAERRFSNLAEAIPTTTLITPAESGTYRITAYTDNSNNSGSYSPIPLVYWTDDFATNQFPISNRSIDNVGTAGWSIGDLAFRAVANQPIQISILYSHDELGVYSAYIILERLD